MRAAWDDGAQIHAKFARQLTYGWTGVRFAAVPYRCGHFGGCHRQCGNGADFGDNGWRGICGRAVACSWSWSWSWSCGGRRGGSCGAGDAQLEDRITGTDFVVQLDAQALNHAGGRRGDFHTGLVGFEHQKRLISLDSVTDLDQQFDDLGLTRGANVRHRDVLQ